MFKIWRFVNTRWRNWTSFKETAHLYFRMHDAVRAAMASDTLGELEETYSRHRSEGMSAGDAIEAARRELKL